MRESMCENFLSVFQMTADPLYRFIHYKNFFNGYQTLIGLAQIELSDLL